MRQLRRAPSLPQQIHLSVTDRCFLPCLHCDIWKNDTTDLPTQDWLDVIDKLGSWCPNGSMNFVGGETLLRKDLEILIQIEFGLRKKYIYMYGSIWAHMNTGRSHMAQEYL